ncbi:MAG TPA: hypothetical protein VK983_02300 [Candidatus Limnocylindrales bacterium]|nr:hypothetical protein [Candidatus Limnocylindrales bacterium]
MIEQLFGSKTRVKLLHLFYGNPNRQFYVREITRKIDEQINSVRRELANLLSIGLIKSDTTNNRLYYEVNQDYQFYTPLSAIFGQGAMPAPTPVQEGESPAAVVSHDIRTVGNVDIAVYTGQFTRDNRAGVDVFLVGDVNHAKIQRFMTDLELQEGKELRYTMMSLKDFKYRQQINDRFVANILAAKKQILIDKHGLLQ